MERDIQMGIRMCAREACSFDLREIIQNVKKLRRGVPRHIAPAHGSTSAHGRL